MVVPWAYQSTITTFASVAVDVTVTDLQPFASDFLTIVIFWSLAISTRARFSATT